MYRHTYIHTYIHTLHAYIHVYTHTHTRRVLLPVELDSSPTLRNDLGGVA